MSRLAVKQDLVDSSELNDEQLQIGMRRLAKLRSNLKALRAELTEKILDGVKECKATIQEGNLAVGELNATLRNKQDE